MSSEILSELELKERKRKRELTAIGVGGKDLLIFFILFVCLRLISSKVFDSGYSSIHPSYEYERAVDFRCKRLFQYHEL